MTWAGLTRTVRVRMYSACTCTRKKNIVKDNSICRTKFRVIYSVAKLICTCLHGINTMH